MGSCASSHKHTVESNDAKFQNSFGSKSDNKFVVYSPVKDNKPGGELRLKVQPDPSHNFPDFGMFFCFMFFLKNLLIQFLSEFMRLFVICFMFFNLML